MLLNSKIFKSRLESSASHTERQRFHAWKGKEGKGKGNDYFDIFGAAHNIAAGAIDGANMLTDGVIGGGLSAAGGALGGLNRMADGTLKAQLRFERHPSVHKLSLNMWGEKYHSRQYYTSLCQPDF